MLSEMVRCCVCLQMPMLTNSPIVILKLSFFSTLIRAADFLISCRELLELLVSEKENSVGTQRSNLQPGSSPV